MKQNHNQLAPTLVAALFAAPLALLLSSQASAQTTVFSDDFSDNNRDGWYIFNGGDPIERSLDTTGGDMETVSTSFAIWGALSNFSSLSLANEGDFIKLELDYTVIEDIAGRNMTFGLYNSGETTISVDQSGLTNLGNESGYLSYNQSDEMRLTYNSGQGLGNVNGDDNVKVTYGDPPANPFSVSGSTFTFSLNIEVNSAGNIVATQIFNEGQANELSMSGTGGAQFTGNVFTFDTVAIQAIDNDFAIDNVLVTTNVPEPSSFALLAGMLGLTCVMLRRRG